MKVSIRDSSVSEARKKVLIPSRVSYAPSELGKAEELLLKGARWCFFNEFKGNPRAARVKQTSDSLMHLQSNFTLPGSESSIMQHCYNNQCQQKIKMLHYIKQLKTRRRSDGLVETTFPSTLITNRTTLFNVVVLILMQPARINQLCR